MEDNIEKLAYTHFSGEKVNQDNYSGQKVEILSTNQDT